MQCTHMEHHISLRTRFIYFVFSSEFLTTTTNYFKAFSSARCQRTSESMDFTSEITDSVK